MCHSVQNDTVEKSDEVKLWCNDYCQLHLTMSVESENAIIGRCLRHNTVGSGAVQDTKNELPCTTEQMKHLTQITMPYTSVIGEATNFFTLAIQPRRAIRNIR